MEDRMLKLNIASNKGQFCLSVDLNIPASGVTVIFGPSGSGKTTLLRCIAGLEKGGEGAIRYGGDVWQSETRSLPTHRRSLAYIFQEPSLFAHLNVRGNLIFAKKRARTKRGIVSFEQAVSLCDILHLLDRDTQDLSGGEKQRVALARALLANPALLLMDEPLASLDDMRKQEILPFLKRISQELSIPIIYVTHSINELMRLADRVVVLDQGTVKKYGSVLEVFGEMESSIDTSNERGVIVEAKVVEHDKQWQLVRAQFNGGSFWLQNNDYQEDQILRVRVLAKDISLTSEEPKSTSILNVIPAKVVAVDENPGQPSIAHVKLKAASTVFFSNVTKRSVSCLNIKSGDLVWMQIKSVALVR